MLQPEIDEDALTAAHKAVEDVLIEFRDRRISVLGCANGFVVREQDGTSSGIMRLGTREGLRTGITAYLDAGRSRRQGGPLTVEPVTYSQRETRLLAAAQAFLDATRGGTLEAFIPWRDLRAAVAAYPLHVAGSKEA